jgi:hypothetical protein
MVRRMDKEPEKHPAQSEEDWQEQLEEMRAYAKRCWRQSGGQVDVYPYQGSRPPPKQ